MEQLPVPTSRLEAALVLRILSLLSDHIKHRMAFGDLNSNGHFIISTHVNVTHCSPKCRKFVKWTKVTKVLFCFANPRPVAMHCHHHRFGQGQSLSYGRSVKWNDKSTWLAAYTPHKLTGRIWRHFTFPVLHLQLTESKELRQSKCCPMIIIQIDGRRCK